MSDEAKLTTLYAIGIGILFAAGVLLFSWAMYGCVYAPVTVRDPVIRQVTVDQRPCPVPTARDGGVR